MHLNRKALKEKLNVAMYPIKSNVTQKILKSYTEAFNHTKWKWMAGLEMDLLAEHFRWDKNDKNEVAKILGSNEARIFTILRDPVDQFESRFSYADLDKLYGLSLKDLIQLLQNASTAEINEKYYELIKKNDTFGRNQIAWDLGLSPDSFDDEKAVDELIARIEKDFDLVMITERMDESLILLRHLLCWPLENVTSLVTNARNPKYIVKLNPEERQVLRRHWLSADERIYRHFYNIFDAKIKAFGRSAMQEEVGKLRQANQKLQDRCVMKQV